MLGFELFNDMDGAWSCFMYHDVVHFCSYFGGLG